jgi:hypothetical protein
MHWPIVVVEGLMAALAVGIVVVAEIRVRCIRRR